MKKILFIIFTFFLTILNVHAAADDTNLYCEYSNSANGSSAYYMLIEFTSTNIDTFSYEFKTIPDGNDISTRVTPNTKEDLVQYDILHDGHLRCPDLAIKSSGTDAGFIVLSSQASSGDQFLYVTDSSFPLDDPNYFQDENNEIVEKPVFDCFYLSQSTDKSIHVYRYENGGDTYITYPDGTIEKTSYPITETCQDFYFNTKTNQIKLATYDYQGNITQMQTYDPTMYKFICDSSSGGNSDVEYFCEEGCKYSNNANIDCKKTSQTINKGNINLEEVCNIEGVENSLRFIGYLIIIVKIIIPILLIVLGVVDYAKAVVSSDTDSVQKATSTLIKRIIIGIAIFFIPTIVNLVFKSFLHTDNSYDDCRVCLFEPSKCD